MYILIFINRYWKVIYSRLHVPPSRLCDAFHWLKSAIRIQDLMDFRFSRCRLRGVRYSGLKRRVICLRPWRWMPYVPTKRLETCTELHGVTTALIGYETSLLNQKQRIWPALPCICDRSVRKSYKCLQRRNIATPRGVILISAKIH
jgi:hypothetical protein